MKHSSTKILLLCAMATFAQLANSQTLLARFGVEPELRVGARLSSANGKYVLLVQGDGNVVVYRVECIGNPACSTFDTETSKRTNTPILRHQGDGNIVLYDGSNMKALWTAGARGYADYRLSVSDTGELIQQQITYRARWSYKTGRPKRLTNRYCSPRDRSICEILESANSHIRSSPGVEKQLVSGGQLVSPDGNFTFVVQSDGNAVVYRSPCVGDPTCSVFPTGTNGMTSAPVLKMQSDGNLVLYDASDPTHLKDLFRIGVTGSGEYLLALQNDANLVVYQAVVLSERTIKRPPPIARPTPAPNPAPAKTCFPWNQCISLSTVSPSTNTYSNQCSFSVELSLDHYCNVDKTPFWRSTIRVPASGNLEFKTARSECRVLEGNTQRIVPVQACE